MGSGGAQTLWPPSNGAGVVVQILIDAHLLGVLCGCLAVMTVHPSTGPACGRVVVDGGIHQA